jgi:hypothetical protein
MAVPVHGESNQANIAGVSGFSSVADGTRGDTQSSGKNGVVGGNESTGPVPPGVPGGHGVFGFSTNPNAAGVFGASNATSPVSAPGGSGVFGFANAPGAAGVFGANNRTDTGVGVQGTGPQAGVSGFSPAGAGVRAESSTGTAIEGFAHATNQSAIFGLNDATGTVPDGLNRPAGAGVWGHTHVEKGSGVVGSIDGSLTQAAGVTGIGRIAGQFFGDVIVTGDVKLTGGDLAENFEVADAGAVEPGTVMVLDGVDRVRMSEIAYDKRVAGVVAGAGNYRPGITLDHHDDTTKRRPLALVGKVFCKVDASYASIELGDLLTTSPTPGHAMKAADPSVAFGAVLGKAMADHKHGRGLIPVLIALQ